MEIKSKKALSIGLLLPIILAVSVLIVGLSGYYFVGKAVFWVLVGILFFALGIWKLPK